MKAETRTLQEVLHGDRKFVVPVYQRPYVWEQERQWEPLWSDIEATASRLAEVRAQADARGVDPANADQGASPHFLGALVIEDRRVMTGEVDTRLVVDGQQRLTTLQLLLRGVLDAFEVGRVDSKLQARIRKAIRNDAEVVGPDDLLKLVPRQAEQSDFAVAMSPDAPTPGQSKFAACRDYFRQQAEAFLVDSSIDTGTGTPTEATAGLLTATLLGLVKLVVIDLDDVDDAQVIFEALNARNTPLSATDLVKNLLFMRAQAHHSDPEQLYNTLWRRFDDDGVWWLEAVGVGHAQRARQDWLLGDWLIAQLGRPINVGRLYGEFRRWIDESGAKPLDALQTLNQYADAYEVLNGRRAGASAPELEAFGRIERLNISVAMPVMLWLLVQPEERLPLRDRELAIRALESFVVRRMAAKYQTRTYGAVFVEVLKAAQSAEEDIAGAVITALRSAPFGYAWPTTNALADAFTSVRYYGPGGINQERLRMLLGAVDALLQREALKSEVASVDYDSLQIEHVLPRSWRQQWPVSGAPDELPELERSREDHVNRIGNLTLANGALNPAMSNNPWEGKRQELQKHSKLQLNALLVEQEAWDEARIVERGAWLAEQVDRVWPGPSSLLWERPAAD